MLRGDHLLQVALPMGGIGAGSISLSGCGGFQDFAIRNRPSFTALPDGHRFTDAAFAVLRVTGPRGTQTRLVEGPIAAEKVYDQGLQGQGYRKGGHEGLPRFAKATFVGAYPFGTVRLSHPKVPVAVEVTGWSPFVPGDDLASGLPAAIADYTLTNASGDPVEIELSFHLSHLAVGRGGERGTRSARIDGGVRFFNDDPETAETFGSAALVALDHAPRVKAMWFRGGWFDPITALWRELESGAFSENDGDPERGWEGGNGGSTLVALRLEPGQSATVPFAVCWHFPNVATAVGNLGAPRTDGGPAWRPWYAGRFDDAAAVATHLRSHHGELRRRTEAFRDALFASDLPAPVLDAVSANLAILKSPTVLRQENGNVWGWEGCFTGSGCCHGTCTHVWNYAQALPHLFPALERTLREQELGRSIDGRGHVNFRAALPDGPTTHDFHAAADGQLGGILKLYRDWRIGGDTAWMRGLYPAAKRSLEYCVAAWDPERTGLLVEPHHNTYDIEFWGPDGMCSSVYIGALVAMAAMADAAGDPDGPEYAALAETGARAMDAELFEHGYYRQKVRWSGLRDQSFARSIAPGALLSPSDGLHPEVLAVLRAEGPKYQYGAGCLSDGVIGAWMAELYGLETPLDPAHVASHLASVHAHNFVPDLVDHACTQRPGYAIAGEGGLLLCSWPHGEKPLLPFPYSDEVWTGIEYQVAVHCILRGLVDEGEAIVAAARARYDGRVRNPWNEVECGNFYARAMASYALLQAYSGLRYDRVERALHLAPRMRGRRARCFFAADGAWGTVTVSTKAVEVEVVEGELELGSVHVDGRTIPVARTARPGATVRVRR